jgi:putative sterol carrier protein
MTYSELVSSVKKAYLSADVSTVNEHVAVQFNVYGEGEGAFYLEIADGKVDVQPYEYYDRDAVIIATAQEIADIAAGKLDIIEANNSAKIQVEGSIDKASVLSRIAKQKNVSTNKTEKLAEKPAKKAAKPAKLSKAR